MYAVLQAEFPELVRAEIAERRNQGDRYRLAQLALRLRKAERS